MTAPRFATITLNASIDTASALPRLIPGTINRLATAQPAAGGKGNNVARVLARLGHPVLATGLAAGHAGAFIADSLRASGVTPAFMLVPGQSRTCLTVVEEESGRVTEIREPGVQVTAADGERFLGSVASLLGSAERVAISGSLPPGLADDYYAVLVGVLRKAGKRVVLDTSGEPLRLAVAAGADAVAPNRDELADLVGPVGNDEEAIAAASMLVRERFGSDGCLLLTLGAAGAAYIDKNRVLWGRPPAVEIANPVGAGDAFLAGWLAGGNEPAEALRLAVAVGTAAAMTPAIGEVDPADVARIRAAVEVE